MPHDDTLDRNRAYPSFGTHDWCSAASAFFPNPVSCVNGSPPRRSVVHTSLARPEPPSRPVSSDGPTDSSGRGVGGCTRVVATI